MYFHNKPPSCSTCRLVGLMAIHAMKVNDFRSNLHHAQPAAWRAAWLSMLNLQGAVDSGQYAAGAVTAAPAALSRRHTRRIAGMLSVLLREIRRIHR